MRDVLYLIELFPQSGKNQFISTSKAEIYYEDPTKIPQCLVCKRTVSYHEWDSQRVEFACHGNILRFHFIEGFLARVEELKE